MQRTAFEKVHDDKLMEIKYERKKHELKLIEDQISKEEAARKDCDNVDADESVHLSDLSEDNVKKEDPLELNRQKRFYYKKIKLKRIGEVYKK